MNDLLVIKLDAANPLLAEARTIQQTHHVVALAGAAEIYARHQKLGDEAIGYAHSIKIYALRKLGEMLKATDRATGGEYGGKAKIDGGRNTPSNPTPRLADHGIDKEISRLARQIVDLPPEKVQAVAEWAQSLTQVQRGLRAERIRCEVSLPEAKYRVIYADPPWKYGDELIEGTKELIEAVERGDIAVSAANHLTMLKSEDFPDDELPSRFSKIVQKLTDREPQGDEGSIQASAFAMSDEDASSVADEIVSIYADIAHRDPRNLYHPAPPKS